MNYNPSRVLYNIYRKKAKDGGGKMIDEAYICKKITVLRMEKGISARDMSLSLGQNPGYINRIENGKSLPSMEMFLYICDYLKISPKDFFDEEQDIPQVISEIKDRCAELSEEKCRLLLDVARSLKEK